MRLINWLWLEEQLIRGAEDEIRRFAATHRREQFYAFCLEYEGHSGRFRLSYGTHDAVDLAARQLQQSGRPVCYRALELEPAVWRFRNVPRVDATGDWEAIDRHMERYAAAMQDQPEPAVAGFLWTRLHHLSIDVVSALEQRDAFQSLGREAQFLAFATCEEERVSAREARIAKQYPNYEPGVLRWLQPGVPRKTPACAACGAAGEGVELMRCSYCRKLQCPACRAQHGHAELAERRPFFPAEVPESGEGERGEE